MLRINWKKGTLLAMTAVLALALAAGCGKKDEQESGANAVPGAADTKIVAEYKDGKVTEEEYAKYTAFFKIVNPDVASYLQIPQLQEQFLKEYVGYKILQTRLPEQTEETKKETETKTNEFYDQLKEAEKTNADLKKQVEDAKLSETDIKYFYGLITSIMANEQDKVTDEQVQKKYDETKDDYNIVTLRHVLVGTTDGSTGEELRTEEEALKRAQEVKKKLDAGGDWTALAKEYSDDPGSKDKGGLYDAAAVGGYVTEFKDAANKQEIGKIGEPVLTQYGYHVIKVEKREATAFDKLTAEQKSSIEQSVASATLNDFMTKELPGLITKTNLPQTPTEGTTDGGTTNSGATEGATKEDGAATNGTTDSGASTNAEKSTEEKK
ncbi:peptidylprolyl isomerase [Paenibacillus xanthanilyticus]|uniref:Peptidylprolyl isomerase n=1 Tax=Paenibacillus xanthanilyticus TaxID=1783531 RepID=A0ABV8JWY4_9BACL